MRHRQLIPILRCHWGLNLDPLRGSANRVNRTVNGDRKIFTHPDNHPGLNCQGVASRNGGVVRDDVWVSRRGPGGGGDRWRHDGLSLCTSWNTNETEESHDAHGAHRQGGDLSWLSCGHDFPFVFGALFPCVIYDPAGQQCRVKGTRAKVIEHPVISVHERKFYHKSMVVKSKV